jgi:hypothetical protein
VKNANQAIREALAEVLDYLERDEYRNWAECGWPKNHIYSRIVKLRRWLEPESR